MPTCFSPFKPTLSQPNSVDVHTCQSRKRRHILHADTESFPTIPNTWYLVKSKGVHNIHVFAWLSAPLILRPPMWVKNSYIPPGITCGELAVSYSKLADLAEFTWFLRWVLRTWYGACPNLCPPAQTRWILRDLLKFWIEVLNPVR